MLVPVCSDDERVRRLRARPCDVFASAPCSRSIPLAGDMMGQFEMDMGGPRGGGGPGRITSQGFKPVRNVRRMCACREGCKRPCACAFARARLPLRVSASDLRLSVLSPGCRHCRLAFIISGRFASGQEGGESRRAGETQGKGPCENWGRRLGLSNEPSWCCVGLGKRGGG